MTWVFVYAADSGRVNAALDWVHKLVSPGTYQCALCRVTYGVFGKKDEWEQALSRLPGEKQFLHRDEFRRAYPGRTLEAPSVWTREGEVWTRALGAGEWEGIDDVPALEARLARFLQREVS